LDAAGDHVDFPADYTELPANGRKVSENSENRGFLRSDGTAAGFSGLGRTSEFGG
jgi:hypothetical protein